MICQCQLPPSQTHQPSDHYTAPLREDFLLFFTNFNVNISYNISQLLITLCGSHKRLIHAIATKLPTEQSGVRIQVGAKLFLFS